MCLINCPTFKNVDNGNKFKNPTFKNVGNGNKFKTQHLKMLIMKINLKT